jgi:hypothetical protein
MKLRFALLISLLFAPALFADGKPAIVSKEGKKLAEFYDSFKVDQLWLSGRYVDWKTGEPLNKPVTDSKPHTHCSAFAAAACDTAGVYLLHPPEHSVELLANAQYDWLQGDGKKQGWVAIDSAWQAQQEANRGRIVVAVYKESDPKKHGHIALVRPSETTEEKVQAEGPRIIQAGMDNYVDGNLKEGFKHHKDAFADAKIKFFAHDVDLKEGTKKK